MRQKAEHESPFIVKAVEHPIRSRRSWSFALGSFRIQLLLCLGLGLLLPVSIYAFYVFGNWGAVIANVAARNSVIAGAIATLVGVIVVRKLGEFPGTIGASYIFPAFAATYSIVVATILFARAPYSGILLFLIFSASLVTRFAIGALEQRSDKRLYFLVPGGGIERIRRDLEVPCIMLTSPQLPHQPGAIIVADLHHDHSAEWERAFATAALRGIGVYHYKQVWEAQTGMVRIEKLSENSLGSLIPSNSYAKMKRLIDVVLTVFILPFLLVPLLVAAVLIRLDSPGPVFFRQERIGYRGRPFDVLKFRTMRISTPAAADDDPVHRAITRDGDDRITRVGRFLRQTRIDELPQLYNILRGEMSWIGPRPEARPLSEWYEREIPFYSYRHIVRPGVTGWAQVNQGHVAGISEVHDKLRFDFYYIKNFSMWIELVILFKTVLVVIRGFGAK
ncbi:UDP-N-acetylgalactosamine-undecaprenyl-phosphate N-acetylgalactosaminephosphotransferase [Sphingopyxis granuli]|uniref:UDP-N-acetylgalactosamine-undecaprenyl-phosphate N-acetylgalactosaminephosphotransferase n=1 Tax=Sphingopyxis granuli TaxID=267128 RepID=A0AA86GKQ6_9SPHN|nr:UDP-N-acetylgalactosamine-undecaprenyl-phosphate N-acetylgalactosaminephosphotransferase [Sphingopyxis granuli]